MTTVSQEIPLLPLPAVLFPGTFLPMQLRHEPQRSLFHTYAQSGGQVGVVLNSGNADASGLVTTRTTGCLASIALLLSDHDDKGVISTILYGEQRMRVIEFTQQEPYLAGRIEPLEDYTGLHAERRTKQATDLFDRYLDLVRRRYGVEVMNMALPSDPNMVSYLLAAVMQLPLDTKQRWLETTSAAYRLEDELTFLHTECEKHAAFLSLSQQTNRRYLHPEDSLYSAIISNN